MFILLLAGLRQAKMKVLEMVHGLEVKDIKSFVDWMKTFRVNYDSGGMYPYICTTYVHTQTITLLFLCNNMMAHVSFIVDFGPLNFTLDRPKIKNKRYWTFHYKI